MSGNRFLLASMRQRRMPKANACEQNIDLINVKSVACSHVHHIGPPMQQCVFRSLGRLDALLRREGAA